jgi:hypothetical protein
MSVYYVFVCKYITLFHCPDWPDRSMGLRPYIACAPPAVGVGKKTLVKESGHLIFDGTKFMPGPVAGVVAAALAADVRGGSDRFRQLRLCHRARVSAR